MDDRRRLGVQDALWLEMDRPNNLMVVDSVIWTAEPLDFGKVREVVEERLLNRFPVFRSRAVQDDDGSWWWEPDQDFDFDNHVALVSLNKPNDPRALQELVAAHRTEMLDHDRPLWQAIWVKRYGKGSAMILRSHHAIADGTRMVQLSMSLFDSAPRGRPDPGPRGRSGTPPTRTHPASRWHSGCGRPRPVPRRRPVMPSAGVVGGIVDAPRLLAKAGRFGRFALRNPLGAGNTVVTAAQATGTGLVQTVRSALPGGGALVDVFSARRPAIWTPSEIGGGHPQRGDHLDRIRRWRQERRLVATAVAEWRSRRSRRRIAAPSTTYWWPAWH